MPKKAKICSNYAQKKLCFISKKSIIFAQKHNYAPNGNTGPEFLTRPFIFPAEVLEFITAQIHSNQLNFSDCLQQIIAISPNNPIRCIMLGRQLDLTISRFFLIRRKFSDVDRLT